MKDHSHPNTKHNVAMNKKSAEIRLYAIMFTDIVGYTAIMQKDRRLGIEMAQNHETIVNRCAADFNGSVVNFYGDGSLTIFESVTDAIHCAKEIQKAATEEFERRRKVEKPLSSE